MKEIMEVAKYIRKEVDRADMYAYEANKHKEQYPDMAQHYYKAAQEHLSIADDLHNGAVRLIESTRRSGAQPSEEMMKMWAFEHEMLIDSKDCVLRKLDMYKA